MDGFICGGDGIHALPAVAFTQPEESRPVVDPPPLGHDFHPSFILIGEDDARLAGEAIAADDGAQALLKVARVGNDAGTVEAEDSKAFLTAAATRQWAREPKLRLLA